MDSPLTFLKRGSRRRIALVAVVLFLLLDLGRSVYSRTGFAQPVQRWEPDPKVYANLTWPPGADVPATASPGIRVYARYCATCHGPDGRGNGPGAPSLVPRPRDFTKGQFKFKSTPAGSPPSDADLERVVTDGLQASAMPYFRDVLSLEEIRQVVAHVKALSPVFTGSAAESVTVPPQPAADALSVARGRRLYDAQGCATCHGTDGRSRRTLADAKGYPVVARDLTAPWTFAGGSDPEHVWLRLTTGMAPGPMPAYALTSTPDERWDLVNYVASLRRTPPWEPGGKLDGPGHSADLTKRGEYLVRAEICGLCHTQLNPTGIYRVDDAFLAGGQRGMVYPQAIFVTPNLTSDPETGLGRWTEQQVADATRNGRAPGRILNLWGMPWHFFHNHTEEDALAIGRYLKSLPPVYNRIPAPLHPGFVETVIAKLRRPFPGADPKFVSYADGNFGQPRTGVSRALPQQLLSGAQWLVVMAGALAWFLAAPPDRRLTRAGGWRRRVFTALILVALCTAGWVAYARPALALLPPDAISKFATGATPMPDPAKAPTPEHAALAARGRYIYLTAPCAMCHDLNGAGGLKINWAPHGTLWAGNLSPDRETGLGAWSEREIARAIRSGISRDGRVLHWQGMTWDYSANYDEEDIRAVIAYLRTLPPTRHQVPAYRPPAEDDCFIYSFWIEKTTRPGCDPGEATKASAAGR